MFLEAFLEEMHEGKRLVLCLERGKERAFFFDCLVFGFLGLWFCRLLYGSMFIE